MLGNERLQKWPSRENTSGESIIEYIGDSNKLSSILLISSLVDYIYDTFTRSVVKSQTLNGSIGLLVEKAANN